ncbi:hypothetical protein TIFTF001_050478 [Ficus carica]|uniref:Cytochrome P450 n=1 Tax=Ficus carica TaxID=3494 RepID=A0AA87Z1G3_FICCA|nr:hypothetical protein TIFTF001_050478 [Ficus carica]
MEVSVLKLCSVVLAIIITTWAWRVVNWVWVRPRRIEKCLRKQGFKGNSYRLLFGDLKENFSVTKEARSKPINLSDDIATRVVPFVLRTVHTYVSEKKRVCLAADDRRRRPTSAPLPPPTPAAAGDFLSLLFSLSSPLLSPAAPHPGPPACPVRLPPQDPLPRPPPTPPPHRHSLPPAPSFSSPFFLSSLLSLFPTPPTPSQPPGLPGAPPTPGPPGRLFLFPFLSLFFYSLSLFPTPPSRGWGGMGGRRAAGGGGVAGGVGWGAPDGRG